MNDFRLRPQSRTPAVGNDFRLIPGWNGEEAVANVGGLALAANPLASGEVMVGFTIMVSGLAIASNPVALGVVSIRRTVTCLGRSRWFDINTFAPLSRIPWVGFRSFPVVVQGRTSALKHVPTLKRALWVGMRSIQQVTKAVWVPLQAIPSVAFRAAWVGLSPQHLVSRIRWGSLTSVPSHPVRAKWNPLISATQMVRARFGSLNFTPSSLVHAKWNGLIQPWIRHRIRWGRLVAPLWVWPRPTFWNGPKPSIPPSVADRFRLFLRNSHTLYDFRLRLGGPFLLTTQKSYLMSPTCVLYRLSDNLPLVGESITLRADRDSYGWACNLQTPDKATIDALFTAEPPESFVAVINGHAWHLQPQSYSQRMTFGQVNYGIVANSRTALLDSPFIEATSGSIDSVLSLRQIAEAALAPTDFELIWQVDVDPILPVGMFTWTNQTIKQRLRAIADALGATLQSVRDQDRIIITPRMKLAPWERAGHVPDVVLEGSLITSADLGLAQPMVSDCVFVSGKEVGYSVKVTLNGTIGQYPEAPITESYLTDVLSCRERGRQTLAAAANQKTIAVETVLNTAGNPPGVLEPGTLMEVVIGTSRWLDEVMSCSIAVKFGEVTQTIGFGEGRGNAYVRLQRLLPTDPLLVGEVTAMIDGISTVELLGGGIVKAIGDSVDIGARAFVQAGKIQGEAPSLPGASVEV